MTEHDELVAEIPHVEKMATAERLKHAKKRRQQQLKKYNQYDKQVSKCWCCHAPILIALVCAPVLASEFIAYCL